MLLQSYMMRNEDSLINTEQHAVHVLIVYNKFVLHKIFCPKFSLHMENIGRAIAAWMSFYFPNFYELSLWMQVMSEMVRFLWTFLSGLIFVLMCLLQIAPASCRFWVGSLSISTFLELKTNGLARVMSFLFFLGKYMWVN